MLNEHFDAKHIRDDLHHGGMDDSLVYKLAVEQGRIILTSNVKDFRPLIREDSPGVISIPETWSTDRVDTKLTALLMREKPGYFRGHLRSSCHSRNTKAGSLKVNGLTCEPVNANV